MLISEIVSPEQQRIDAMKKQAEAAQKRVKQAALQLKLRKAQQQLSKLTTQ